MVAAERLGLTDLGRVVKTNDQSTILFQHLLYNYEYVGEGGS